MEFASKSAIPLLVRTVTPLLAWYRANGRPLPWRADPSPYRVWVSEIMLQQTRIETVKPYFERFMAALPDIASLAAAADEPLLKLWEGLGYYRRVRNLREAARQVVERFGGELPAGRDELLTLPGIGDYTAGAISAIAFGRPEPAVDGNVMRVTARLLASDEEVTRQAARETVRRQWQQVWPRDDAGMFTQALMELGEVLCLPGAAPLCGECPCRAFCRARAEGCAADLPRRAAAAARPIEEKTLFLLLAEGAVALRRRPETGLLAGMWEFPSVEGSLDAAGARRVLAAQGIAAEPEPAGSAKHLFTHREWRMTGFLVRLPARIGGWTWAEPAELTGRYALPGAFRSFRSRVLAELAPSSK